MTLLPAPPLRLKWSFVIWGWTKAISIGAGCLALFVLGVREQASSMQRMLRDAELWEKGEPARGASVHGKERSSDFVVNSYELTVRYVDGRGRTHEGKSEFGLLFGSVDQKEPVVVHLDPARPDDFVLSWAVTRIGRRWAYVLSGGLLMVLGWLLIGVAWPLAIVHEQRSWRGAVSSGEEVALPVTKVVTLMKGTKDTGRRRYHYRHREVDHSEEFAKGQAPLLDETGRALVALVEPGSGHRAKILRSDLHPLAKG